MLRLQRAPLHPLLLFILAVLALAGCSPGPQAVEATEASETIAERRGESGEASIDQSFEYFWLLRTSPSMVYPTGELMRAWAQLNGPLTAARPATPAANEWTFVGPKNLDPPAQQYYGTAPIVGRVMSLAVTEQNPPRFYIGGSHGGVWTGTDDFKWRPLSDQLFPYMMAGALAVRRDKLYLGTGDVPRCSGTFPPLGSFRSMPTFGAYVMDRGTEVWSPIPDSLTKFGSIVRQDGTVERPGAHVGAVVACPESEVLLFATAYGSPRAGGADNPNGIWRYDGRNWTQFAPGQNYVRMCFGALSPATGRRYYYAVSTSQARLARSLDEGKSWEFLDAPYTANNRDGVAVAASPTEPTTVYLLSMADRKAWKSSKAGNVGTWVDITDNLPGMTGDPDYTFFTQANYNWFLACGSVTLADSTKKDVLIAGGIEAAVYNPDAAAGNRWTSLGNAAKPTATTHVDQHVAFFSAGDPSTAYFGNDGGIYRAKFRPDLSFTLENLMTRERDTRFGISQIYKLSVAGADHRKVLAGLQDNSVAYASNAAGGAQQQWSNPAAFGDGCWNDISRMDERIQVAAGYRAGGSFSLRVTSDGWANSVSPPGNFAGGESSMFFPPVAFDTSNDNFLYTAFERLHSYKRTTNTWTTYGNRLSTQANDRVVCMAVAPSNWRYVYTGSFRGEVWLTKWRDATTIEFQRVVSKNGKTDIDNPLGLPVTSISVDENDPKRVIVSLGGNDRRQNASRVWLTANAEAADADREWSDVHRAPLPKFPVNAVRFYPGRPNEWWVVSDLGVFYTTSGGAAYANATRNLPFTVVNDIRFVPGSDAVTVATFGRGIWQSTRARLFGGMTLLP